MSNTSNNRLIAKNAIFMYFRMGITILVGLYTSRVVLLNLGIEDYGLFNVIGGIIAMFNFLNNSMINTSSRYITVYLAKGDVKELNNIFSMTFIIHFFLGVIIVVLGETLGLWYLNNIMIIPDGREFAAHWLYQLSILSCFISILYVPFNALIVAHEKMNIFAYISIVDVFLKLIIVLMLDVFPFDKLIFYGSMLACVSFIVIVIYFSYCKRNFIESKLTYYWNKIIFKDMLRFAGWSLIGNFSYIFYSQGINLMLNAFCGPAVNAARGIAVQIEGVVKQFANNLQVAINPQIIKSYASNNVERMYSLVFASSRLCFYLLFIISLPILIETEFILKVWLLKVPEYTIIFIRLIICIALLDAFINPLFTVNLATGKLKVYNLSVCSISYPFMLITYYAIKCTVKPESVFICLFISTIIGVIVRVFVIKKQVGLKPQIYFNQVVSKVAQVIVISIIAPVIFHTILDEGWKRFLLVLFICIISVLLTVFSIGINNNERSFIVSKVKQYLKFDEKYM